jgi:hypothetical protein
MVGERKSLKEGLKRSGLIVRVSGSEMRACKKGSQKRQEKQSSRQQQRTRGRMHPDSLIVSGLVRKLAPRRWLQNSGSALFCFRGIHKDLLVGRDGGVF